MRVTAVYCDCCKKKITGNIGEPELFVTMVTGNRAKTTTHYCDRCSGELIEVWLSKIKEIRKKKKAE